MPETGVITEYDQSGGAGAMPTNWNTLSGPGNTSVGNPADLGPYRGLVQQRGAVYDTRGNDQYDWAKKQFEKNAGIADQVQKQALDTGKTFMDWAKTDRGDYDTIYRPAMKEQMDYARGYTTPERMAANRGAAIAGTNMAFDANADAAKRSLMSYGVDPSAGRFAGLDAGLAAKRATAAAGVGTKSDRDTEMMGQQLLANAIRTGQVLPGQAANEAGVTLAAGNQAVNTGLATTASGAQTMGTPMQWAGLGDDMMKEWKDSLLKQTSLGMQQNKDAAEERLAQAKLDQSSSSGVGAMIGAGAGILGTIVGGPMGGMIGSSLGSMAGKAVEGSGSTVARGGLIRRFADGGITDVEEMEPMPDDEMAEGDQMVTPDMSPSGGQQTDDVPAMLNEGEFVVPKDVTAWHGEKFFQKLIEKARQEMSNRTAEPEPGPPAQAIAQAEPKFASPGTQAARGGMIPGYADGGFAGGFASGYKTTRDLARAFMPRNRYDDGSITEDWGRNRRVSNFYQPADPLPDEEPQGNENSYQGGGRVPGVPFDPEGSGYDYDTAIMTGLAPQWNDHPAAGEPGMRWPGREPTSGVHLKGRRHETFDHGVEEDRKMGYGLEMRDGRYYSVPFGKKYDEGGTVDNLPPFNPVPQLDLGRQRERERYYLAMPELVDERRRPPPVDGDQPGYARPFNRRQFNRDQEDVEALTPHYPTALESAHGRSVDAIYGDPYSGVYEGREGSKVELIPTRDVIGRNSSQIARTKGIDMQVTPPVADYLYRGRMAANKSALAALGMDPTRTALTPAPLGGLGGIYDPKDDRMWSDVNYRDASNVVHEGVHRAIEKLRAKGIDTPRGMEDEITTRAVMQKFYGDTELGHGPPLRHPDEEKDDPARYQMALAKWNYENNPRFKAHIDRLEKAAAEEIRLRRPYGGPR